MLRSPRGAWGRGKGKGWLKFEPYTTEHPRNAPPFGVFQRSALSTQHTAPSVIRLITKNEWRLKTVYAMFRKEA